MTLVFAKEKKIEIYFESVYFLKIKIKISGNVRLTYFQYDAKILIKLFKIFYFLFKLASKEILAVSKNILLRTQKLILSILAINFRQGKCFFLHRIEKFHHLCYPLGPCPKGD